MLTNTLLLSVRVAVTLNHTISVKDEIKKGIFNLYLILSKFFKGTLIALRAVSRVK